MQRRALAVAVLLLTAACASATTRAYRLPLDVTDAPRTLGPLARAAGEAGLRTSERAGAVEVEIDATVRIEWVVRNGRYDMVIHVDHRAVPPAELDRRFAEARARGEDIWERALASMAKTGAVKTR